MSRTRFRSATRLCLDWLGVGARYRRCRLSLRHVLQHFAGAHPLRCVLFPDSVKPRFIAVNSGHSALLSFGQVWKPLFCWNHCGTAGERDCSELQRFARPHNFKGAAAFCPRLDCRSATLAGTEKTPLDLSIAKAQIGPGSSRLSILSIRCLLPSCCRTAEPRLRVLNLRVVATPVVAGRVRNLGTAALGCPGERNSTGVAPGPPHTSRLPITCSPGRIKAVR